MKSVTRGALVGSGAGAMASALGWVLLAFCLALSFLALLSCAGAANMMSVNNVTTSQLLLDIGPLWWELAGDAVLVLVGIGVLCSALLMAVGLGAGLLGGGVLGGAPQGAD